MLAASTPDAPMASDLLSTGTLIALVLGYLVGRAHAVWKRAHADYVRTKQSIPGLRTAMWSRWWSMIKRAAVAVAVTVLLVWTYGAVGGLGA
jgi:hypothetical protein